MRSQTSILKISRKRPVNGDNFSLKLHFSKIYICSKNANSSIVSPRAMKLQIFLHLAHVISEMNQKLIKLISPSTLESNGREQIKTVSNQQILESTQSQHAQSYE